MDPNSTTESGGSQDVKSEEATEDQQPVPRPFVSGCPLLRDPRRNKGLAFTNKEREVHLLHGLLPPVVISQDLQVEKMMHNVRQYEVALQKYMALMDLREMDEKLFYKLLIDNIEELLPVVYTPTVGEACQKYGSIFRRPQGLFISLNKKGKILEVLQNWPERNIQLIVVTDGERILGLGDLGCQGMGIPVAKLSLYTALGGVFPSACLPITIDVGTNNEELLKNNFYIGLQRRRATGEEYSDFMDEFMTAVKQHYGEKVLIQFEDFANHNAVDLLAKYSTTHLAFNDDIQGTTAYVVLAGLIVALKLVDGSLADEIFLILGAGEASTKIAEVVALEITRQTNIPLEDTRKKLWLVDSEGLIVKSRADSLEQFKMPWAHEHESVNTLLDAVNVIKPTVLIGISGVGQTLSKEVLEAMASFTEKPIILALSNSISQCTAEQAYTWTQGRAIFASWSPFPPVEYDGKVYVPSQVTNAYLFPALGLGLIISGAARVHDHMLLAASKALADGVSEEDFFKGLIYPPLGNMQKISAQIAAEVAAKAYELGLARHLPQPENLLKHAKSCMYNHWYSRFIIKRSVDLFTKEELDAFTNFQEEIGRGSYGIVYRGMIPIAFRPNLTSVDIAVKEMNEVKRAEYDAEIDAMTQFGHPNILRIIGRCETAENLYTVTNFIKGNTLSHWLTGDITWEKALKMLCGIAAGLEAMHDIHLVHRDIKPANIMIDGEFKSTIIDFGSTRAENEKEFGFGLTVGYYSSLQLDAGLTRRGLDVYAFGVVALQILMRRNSTFKILTKACKYQANRSHALHATLMDTGCAFENAVTITNLAMQCLQIYNQPASGVIHSILNSMCAYYNPLFVVESCKKY